MTTTSVPDTATWTSAADMGSEVRRLRRTFATGRTLDRRWRRRQLRGVLRMLRDRESEIAAAVGSDVSRSPVETFLVDITPAKIEANYARRHLRRWMRPRRTPIPLAVLPGRAHYRYEPLGVVGVIGPWNYPVNLTLCPVIGALAAGNCVVLKPSEHAPATAALLGRLLPRYVDADAVSVVQGGPEETQELISQELDHVLFTGSPEVGALVLAAAAPHLTPVTLELGGKSPVIITADADLPVAARRIALAKLVNSGQTCIAPDYVLVDRSIQQQLVESLREALTVLQPSLGGGHGGVVNGRHAARLAELLVDHGGTVVCGGMVDLTAATVQPTIVVDPDPGARLMQEEIFGPVLPVLGVSGLDEAIRFVRERPKPLVAHLFSSSADVQRRMTAEVSAGAVVVNQLMFHAVTPQLPFGGVGRSGMGSYHGRWGFETFSHRKAVLVKPAWPDPDLVYPPFTPLKEKLLHRLF